MQTDVHATEPVRQSVVVRRPLAETFALFTDGLDRWWPLHTHSIAADTFEGRVTVESITFEKHVGGRVLERMSDGTVAPWGTMVEDAPSTELELRFTSVGDGSTRIVLEHRGWEVLGPDAAKREGYDDGWRALFELFREAADLGR
jgi:uncharacterized protein YndB with AHSA1/START domain